MLYYLLAQAEAVPGAIAWWERILDKYGFFGVLSLIGLFMLWKYAPRIIENHVAYLKTTRDATEKTARATEVNSKVNERIEDSLKILQDTASIQMNPQGDSKFDFHTFSTVQTNRALKHLAEALSELAADHPAKARVEPHIKNAIEALKRTRVS